MLVASPQNITYQLDILLAEPTRLAIGKLGVYNFPAGRYVYTGSARQYMEARIARHMRLQKKLRWHIDYFLASPYACVTKVSRFIEPECQLNQKTSGLIIVVGFGSSDCLSGCGSHLKYL